MRVHNDFYVTTRALHAGNPSIHWTISVVPWQKSSSELINPLLHIRDGWQEGGRQQDSPLAQSSGEIFRCPWTLIKHPPFAPKKVSKPTRAEQDYKCNLQVWPLFYWVWKKKIATLENYTCKSFIYKIDPCTLVDQIKCQVESRSLNREAWLLTIG